MNIKSRADPTQTPARKSRTGTAGIKTHLPRMVSRPGLYSAPSLLLHVSLTTRAPFGLAPAVVSAGPCCCYRYDDGNAVSHLPSVPPWEFIYDAADSLFFVQSRLIYVDNLFAQSPSSGLAQFDAVIDSLFPAAPGVSSGGAFISGVV